MKKYIIPFCLSCIACLSIGFLAGRATGEKKESVRYVKGKTELKEVKVPAASVTIPSFPKYLFLPDNRIDTAAIIADWIKGRNYESVLFDDEKGKLRLDLSVQYNELQAISYEFTPLTKEITRYKEKTLQPFVSGSYLTPGFIGIGGGIFYHNLGLEYQYLKGLRLNGDGHLIGLRYKF